MRYVVNLPPIVVDVGDGLELSDPDRQVPKLAEDIVRALHFDSGQLLKNLASEKDRLGLSQRWNLEKLDFAPTAALLEE